MRLAAAKTCVVAGAVVLSGALAFGALRSPEPARALQASERDVAAATTVLDAVRNVHPVACELIAHTLDNFYGWSRAQPLLDFPGSRDPAVRAAARWALSRMDDPTPVIGRLRQAIADPDPCVRQVAARLLGRTRHDTAVDALLSALNESNPATREAAAVGLGFTASEAAVPPLIRLLGDPNPDLRVAAAWALGEIESRTAVPPLINALRDAQPRVRAAAAWALGNIQ